MARIRTIKPDMFASYPMRQVSIPARLLFVGMWTEADDEGRLIDSAKRLAGAIYPHDEDITTDVVEQWISDLADIGVIGRYEANRGRYLHICGWNEHQRISHPTPSKFPNPPEKFRKVSRKTPEKLRPEQGTGNREQGTGNREGERPRRQTQIRDDFQITGRMRAWAAENRIRSDINRETEKFIDHFTAKGEAKKDWVAAWRNWMRLADEYGTKNRNGSWTGPDTHHTPLGLFKTEAERAAADGPSVELPKG